MGMPAKDNQLSLVQLRLALLRETAATGKFMVVLLAFAIVVPSLLRGGTLLLTGAIVGRIPTVVDAGFDSPAGRRLVMDLIGIGVLFALSMSAGPLRGALTEVVGRRLEGSQQLAVMAAVLGPPGVAHLERPDIADTIGLAQSVGIGEIRPRAAIAAAVNKYSTQLYGLVAAALLAGFAWWAPLLIIFGWLGLRRSYRVRMRGAVEVEALQTRTLRRSGYFRDLALTAPAAKETRIFGLDQWLMDNFVREWLDSMTEVWRRRRQGGVLMWIAIVSLVAVHALVYGLIGRDAANGAISLDSMVVYIMAVLGVREFADSESDDRLDKGSRPLLASRELTERMAGPEFRLSGERPADGLPAVAIRFEGVRFRYSEQRHEVFAGLNLEIPAGQSLAIVGENGAGKTTLVKLLARLYDPTAGRITVDDIDLRELDASSWSRRIAAIFQDFVRYELSAKDNIEFGALDRAEDDAGREEAVRLAGARDIIDSLPYGWDTILSRGFDQGTDLSGGQWQRIALARALYAVRTGGGVLVLDEPTAQLDARAEADFFDRFLEVTRGYTTIVISHRFSTVRRADRIVVLEGGVVVEQGTHDELVAEGGRYARMFAVQAARFGESAETVGSRDA
jgi:ATP-binding cassette, subfamily B, bacterial